MERHFDMTDAIRPATRAVQSKNMWNESDIRPKLWESPKKEHGSFGKDLLKYRNNNNDRNLPVRPYSIEELDKRKRAVQEKKKENIPCLCIGNY